MLKQQRIEECVHLKIWPIYFWISPNFHSSLCVRMLLFIYFSTDFFFLNDSFLTTTTTKSRGQFPEASKTITKQYHHHQQQQQQQLDNHSELKIKMFNYSPKTFSPGRRSFTPGIYRTGSWRSPSPLEPIFPRRTKYTEENETWGVCRSSTRGKQSASCSAPAAAHRRWSCRSAGLQEQDRSRTKRFIFSFWKRGRKKKSDSNGEKNLLFLVL